MKDLGAKDPETIIEICKRVVKTNKINIEKKCILSNEEAVLIASYTYENKPYRELSPYIIINKKLWDDNTEDQLTNKKSYLHLLLRALRKLPRTKPQTLYRGITKDKHDYKVGEEVEWKGFTSTSTSMKVTQDFLTAEGKVEGTLFEVRDEWGYSVADFSQYPKEEGKANQTQQTGNIFFFF